MPHLVLLGDSIFDNESYVPGGPPVIEQVRRGLPRGWRARLLAVDGAVSASVASQLHRLPEGASHVFVSVGGNDALRHSGILDEVRRPAGEAFAALTEMQGEFRHDYRAMLRDVLSAGLSRLGFEVQPCEGTYFLTAGITLYTYNTAEAQRSQIRSAFGQYLAPAFVEQLAQSPEKLVLGGEEREMTMLFSDVRGFTAISELYKDDAQGLTSLMNRLLTPLTNAIVDHEGTIDKYIGDAVMAFWNAPLSVPNHEVKACAAALAMIECLEVLNAQRREEATSAGQPSATRPSTSTWSALRPPCPAFAMTMLLFFRSGPEPNPNKTGTPRSCSKATSCCTSLIVLILSISLKYGFTGVKPALLIAASSMHEA